MPDGSDRDMDEHETQAVMDRIEAHILGKKLIYSHEWRDGDFLVLENPSLAHIAGPGSQTHASFSGLRLMRRNTVLGSHKPSRTLDQLNFLCAPSDGEFPADNDSYCFYSLKDHLFFP